MIGDAKTADAKKTTISNDIKSSFVDVTKNANTYSSSSAVYESSTGPTGDIASYSVLGNSVSYPSDTLPRINPFDKNNKGEGECHTAKNIAVTGTVSTSNGTSLDDLTKNRFEKYQGVQNRSTGRYMPSSAASDVPLTSSTVTNITSNPSFMLDDRLESISGTLTATSIACTTITTTTTASTNELKRIDSTKNSFESASSYSRSGSMSDADIIFGDFAVKKANSRPSFDRVNSTASASVRTILYDKGVRSLSVSSDKDGDFTHDPRVNSSYRVYEGIQNVGFTDFDSPVKVVESITTEEDEYDLK